MSAPNRRHPSILDYISDSDKNEINPEAIMHNLRLEYACGDIRRSTH